MLGYCKHAMLQNPASDQDQSKKNINMWNDANQNEKDGVEDHTKIGYTSSTHPICERTDVSPRYID